MSGRTCWLFLVGAFFVQQQGYAAGDGFASSGSIETNDAHLSAESLTAARHEWVNKFQDEFAVVCSNLLSPDTYTNVVVSGVGGVYGENATVCPSVLKIYVRSDNWSTDSMQALAGALHRELLKYRIDLAYIVFETRQGADTLDVTKMVERTNAPVRVNPSN